MKYYELFYDMAAQPHLLIAGATGSGKSVVVNGILTTLLITKPYAQFGLIDPKRVELIEFKKTKNCIQYASEPGNMINALQYTMDLIEYRYKIMQKRGIKKIINTPVYVIIDELADLMTTNKKQAMPLLQRICQVGRAADVHVIACTQCPLSSIIPTPIKVNFDARIALRTRSKQDSRNIIEMAGCELLPRYGQAYYMKPQVIELVNIPMYDQTTIDQVISTASPKWYEFWK